MMSASPEGRTQRDGQDTCSEHRKRSSEDVRCPSAESVEAGRRPAQQLHYPLALLGQSSVLLSVAGGPLTSCPSSLTVRVLKHTPDEETSSLCR